MSRLSVVWTRSTDPLAADRILRAEVASRAAVPVETVTSGRLCVRCGSAQHGRPFVRRAGAGPAPAVSLSRCAGGTVVAVGALEAVGVDVERVDAFEAAEVAGVLLHPRERADGGAALATTWVRKEALLKTAGHGLAVDPRTVWLSSPGTAPAILGWPEGHAGPAPTWLVDLDLAADLRAAVAGTGSPPVAVTIRKEGLEGPRG